MTPRKRIAFITSGLVIITFLLLANSLFYKIGNGERGVMYKLFSGGLDTAIIYGEGVHMKAPWNTIYKYNVKIQQQEEIINAISSDGLNLKIDFSIRFSPIKDKIGYLKNQYEKDYISTIIIPQVRSVTRQVIGKYTPEQIYSTKRQEIQTEIETVTREELNKRYIQLDALLIRNVDLPTTIKSAIEDKLAEQQALAKDEFSLQRERIEAQRKIIEAQGVKKFDSIIANQISDKLLQWKGIEATRELAKSPNTKVIVIGGGENGLPIILNDK